MRFIIINYLLVLVPFVNGIIKWKEKCEECEITPHVVQHIFLISFSTSEGLCNRHIRPSVGLLIILERVDQFLQNLPEIFL